MNEANETTKLFKVKYAHENVKAYKEIQREQKDPEFRRKHILSVYNYLREYINKRIEENSGEGSTRAYVSIVVDSDEWFSIPGNIKLEDGAYVTNNDLIALRMLGYIDSLIKDLVYAGYSVKHKLTSDDSESYIDLTISWSEEDDDDDEEEEDENESN